MAKKPKIVEVVVAANMERFWHCEDPEILLEGPAGTGKTFTMLLRIVYLAEKYPGARFLLCRKVRKDMTDSILVTLERDVLSGRDDEILEGPGREHRHSYRFQNGSELVLGGLSEVEGTFSAEYDVIAIFEAIQTTEDDLEKLKRCLRSWVLPFQAIWCDTNPGHRDHWLNKRADTSRMTRFKTWFTDNPVYNDPKKQKYVTSTLASLTGVRLQRLYYGEWVSEEGMIWPNFRSEQHIIDGTVKRREDGYWWLEVPTWEAVGDNAIRLGWFFASVDWGFRAPGCMLVWGVDEQRRMFCVHEIYRTQKNADWWAQRAESLRARFDILRFVCDMSRPETIDAFNERMGRVDGFWIAEGIRRPPKDFLAYANYVRERFDWGGMHFLSERLESREKDLADIKQPTCVTEEIPDYVFSEVKDGRPVLDMPDPGCADHGCDSAQYAAAWMDRKDWTPDKAVESKYKAGTYGAVLGHEDVEPYPVLGA